jgi:hypothetical protein
VVLILAVVAGLAAGWIRARYRGGELDPPALKWVWLVLLAFLPQLLVFFLPVTYRHFSDAMASATLIGSQLLLLLFAWINRSHTGFLALGIGVGLNLLVISLNGGLMPISPETLGALYPVLPEGWNEVGARLGSNKNILLPESTTQLAILSDRFLLPAWFPNRVAFSLGDLFIALGAFRFLWSSSAGSVANLDETDNKNALPSSDLKRESNTATSYKRYQGVSCTGDIPGRSERCGHNAHSILNRKGIGK